MLRKLLKYDIKSIFKYLIIFYILAFIFALGTRIFSSIDNSFVFEIVAKVFSGATIAMIFNIFINCTIRLWVLFKQNMYGDQSYLTHTLPVSKKDLYTSKFINGLLAIFISFIFILLIIFIAYYSKERLDWLKNLIVPIENLLDSSIVLIILAFVFIFFLEIFNMIQAGFTGIIFGHKMNNNKLVFSLVFGFVAYSITQTISVLLLFLYGLINKDVMNLFITSDTVNIDAIKTIIWLSIIIYFICVVILYFVNTKLLKQGVNVE